MILNVTSATTLSYGQPFLLKERLMWKVLSVSSSSLFLNSFRQSVWKTYIFSRFTFTLKNAFFQLCVITPLYNDFILHDLKLSVQLIVAYPLLVLAVVVDWVLLYLLISFSLLVWFGDYIGEIIKWNLVGVCMLKANICSKILLWEITRSEEIQMQYLIVFWGMVWYNMSSDKSKLDNWKIGYVLLKYKKITWGVIHEGCNSRMYKKTW